MKRKHHFNFSYPVVLLLSLSLTIFSSVISAKISIPEQFAKYASYFVMHESIYTEITELKIRLMKKYGNNLPDNIFQKSGSANDILRSNEINLKDTPPDILKTQKKLAEDFLTDKYKKDGVVIENNYSTAQATDIFGNVAVRNVTADTEIDVEEILNSDFSLPITDFSEPLVLIYHTHSTESYLPVNKGVFSSDYPTRNDSKNSNMIRIGEEICNILESNGIRTIHDRKIHDKQYTGAYDRSRETINGILEKYPSIIITLDIHRDAIYYDDVTRIKPTAEIDGKKAAQLMIIAGAEGGTITDFPNWQTNLSFALNLHNYVNTQYKDLMKPVYFCNRKYNMDITPYSLLIETGTDVNTLEEAAYSARLLGSALAKLIKEKADD